MRRVGGSSLTDEQLVDVSFGLGVEETGQVGLVIRVEQENSLVLGCEAVRQVDRGCGLANPPFRFVIVIVFIVSGF